MQMLFDGSRRGPRRRRASACSPARSARLPDGVKRPQMQWNVLDVRAAVAAARRARPTRRGCTSSTRYAADADDPDAVVATCDYGGAGRRRGRARQRVRHAVPPREVERRRACALLANFVGGACRRDDADGPLPGHRPARRAGACACYQGDYDRETVYGDDPVAVAAAFADAGAPWIHVVDLDAARTGEPVNRPVVAAIAAAGRRRRCRPAAACATEAAAAALADAGVARVVIGTAALEDPTLVRARRGAPARSPSGSTHRDGEVARARAGPKASGDELLDVAAAVRRRRRRRARRHRHRARRHARGPRPRRPRARCSAATDARR